MGNNPNDSSAVYLTKEHFDVHADGTHDDSASLQAAIDQVEAASSYGMVFIPEGNYRIGKTIHLWRGIRLIGYGVNRPVFTLAENTPGFQTGSGSYMVQFCHKPAAGGEIHDANNTSYSGGIRNIDVKIEAGNPAAIAVRFHVPQL